MKCTYLIVPGDRKSRCTRPANHDGPHSNNASAVELMPVIAEQLSLIIQNNVTANAIKNAAFNGYELWPSDIIVNLSLLERLEVAYTALKKLKEHWTSTVDGPTLVSVRCRACDDSVRFPRWRTIPGERERPGIGVNANKGGESVCPLFDCDAPYTIVEYEYAPDKWMRAAKQGDHVIIAGGGDLWMCACGMQFHRDDAQWRNVQ